MKMQLTSSCLKFIFILVPAVLSSQTLTLVTEDTASSEVTVAADLIINGFDDATPSLEVGGDASLVGDVSFEEIEYFDDGELRLENYFDFTESGLTLHPMRYKWDDKWRLEYESTFTFNTSGLTITNRYGTVSLGVYGGVTVNGAGLATKNALNSLFSGMGAYSFEFGRGGDYSDGGGVASGQNAVSYGAGVAAGNASWAIGTNRGNSDDGYLGPYSGGKNSHAYGEITRALGNYSFAFGTGTFSREAADIDPSNLTEPGYDPTDATGDYSFAFGYRASAQGAYSMAFGDQSKTYGVYSVVFGRKNTASSRSVTVFGEAAYGASGDTQNWIPTDPLFVIGNSDSDIDYSSALRILKNGHTVIGSHDGVTPGDGTQVLEVLGAVQVGNTISATAGAIRWTGTDFEGYDGTEWKSLTLDNSQPSGPQGDISMGIFVSN